MRLLLLLLELVLETLSVLYLIIVVMLPVFKARAVAPAAAGSDIGGGAAVAPLQGRSTCQGGQREGRR